MPDSYFELRVALAEAQAAVAASVLDEVLAEFAALSGRSYEAVESYRLEDAAHAIVVMGSSAGTVKDVVDELREEGQAVGALQIRCFRPFPTERVAEALRGVTDVAVLDRADSPGGRPPLYAEIAGLAPSVRSHVYGLGGRDLHPEHVRAVFAGEASHYVGLRGGS
jgi:pyruvate ferredoxin oxidoreductase alpha subunit